MSPFARSGVVLVALALPLVACGQGAGDHNSQGTGQASTTTTGVDSAGLCHDFLQAEDGTALSFDYKVEDTSTPGSSISTVYQVSSASLSLAQPSLTGSEKVTGVVLDYGFDSNDPNSATLVSTQNVSFAWDATAEKFIGTIPSALNLWAVTAGDGAAALNRYAFAFEVDGTWLTDPVSGVHNFNYSPTVQNTGVCAGYWNNSR